MYIQGEVCSGKQARDLAHQTPLNDSKGAHTGILKGLRFTSYQERENAAHKIQHANSLDQHRYGDRISIVEVVVIPDMSRYLW